MRMLRLVALVLFLLGGQTRGAYYYVDFSKGDDARSGTSKATAWKHAPGDRNATSVARAVALAPGDMVLFKGAVVYRGSVNIPASGKKGKSITYKGDGWGRDKAILDGSATFGARWTRCASAKELRGNKNYRSIYYTKAPPGYSFIAGTYENSAFIYPSQAPTPSDAFHYDRTDQLRSIPKGHAGVSQTNSSITDTRHFTQADSGFYDGASVLIWHRPNVTRLYKVTGFDPATRTIRHEKIGGAGIYKGRDTYYAILNHPAYLTAPGQYWLDAKTGRLYVWPRRGAPSDNEYSVVAAQTGLNAGGRRHIVIEGFIVQKFVYGIRAAGRGASDVVIRNNEVRNLKSNGKYAIHAGGVNMKVINNRVVDCQRAVGILASGKNVVVQGNYLRRTSRQGIWFMGAEHCQIIGNTVVEIAGTHSNGISVYNFSKNMLIAGNKILRTGSALTYHGNGNRSPKAEGLYIYNNLCDGAVNSWGSKMGAVTLVNNTFLGVANVGGDLGRQVFVNNIAHGGGRGTVRTHNLYTALARWQKPNAKGRWSFAHGEIDWSRKKRGGVFLDLAKGDYQLKTGSPALGTGIDPTQYLPVAIFPNYDFSKDIEGNPHTRDGKWTIGAYGYDRKTKDE